METRFIKIPGSDWEMCEHQVTQEEWYSVMGTNPSRFKGLQNPVETVSFFDCIKYIDKLNDTQIRYTYSLPTEKDWETCASTCDKQDIDSISWNYENSGYRTHPVKTKLPNELGFYDMLGNVWEYVMECNCSFCHLFADIDSFHRAIRGGSWYNSASYLRSSIRNRYEPGKSDYSLGFRLVRKLRVATDSC